MAFEVGIELAQRHQVLTRKGACFGPRRVEQRRGVTLGKHEDVIVAAAGMLRVEAHHREEQYGDDVRCRSAACRVAAAGFGCGEGTIDAQLRSFLLKDAHRSHAQGGSIWHELHACKRHTSGRRYSIGTWITVSRSSGRVFCGEFRYSSKQGTSRSSRPLEGSHAPNIRR